MKKIFTFSIALLMCYASVYAQDTIKRSGTIWERNNLNLRIGPEIGLAMGDFNKTNQVGIGGSAQLDIPVARRFSLIVYAAVKSFGSDVIPNSNNQKYRRAQIYPIRTGINYKLTQNVYAGVQLGESIVQFAGNSKTSVSQAFALGYFNGKLDFAARWDHEYAHGGLSSVNLQATYVITIGMKD